MRNIHFFACLPFSKVFGPTRCCMHMGNSLATWLTDFFWTFWLCCRLFLGKKNMGIIFANFQHWMLLVKFWLFKKTPVKTFRFWNQFFLMHKRRTFLRLKLYEDKVSVKTWFSAFKNKIGATFWKSANHLQLAPNTGRQLEISANPS